MPDKPDTAAGYRPEQTEAVRATCLYVATKLGDLLNDTVVVGGLVPSLLVDQQALRPGVSPHLGTMDLDVGLTLAILDRERYRTLTQALRRAGFEPDTNEDGQLTRQRWRAVAGSSVTVDFLISPSDEEDEGGRLRHIEKDFAAVITPGLQLAFKDRRKIRLSGRTVLGEQATRDVWVCGPGAYVVLKALAFDLRGENKDAYDLYYVVRNFGNGPDDMASAFRKLASEAEAVRAVEILRRDFLEHDAVGPRRVSMFLEGRPDPAVQADVVGYVERFLRSCEE